MKIVAMGYYYYSVVVLQIIVYDFFCVVLFIFFMNNKIDFGWSFNVKVKFKDVDMYCMAR